MNRFQAILVFVGLVSIFIFAIGCIMYQSPTRGTTAPPTSTLVRRRYLISLHAQHSTSAFCTKHGLVKTHSYDWTHNGFAAELNEQELERLHVQPELSLIEPDHQVTIPTLSLPADSSIVAETAPTTLNWNIARIGGPFPASFVDTPVFWLVDTGVDSTHPDLNVLTAISLHPTETTPDDLNGHGTHVAGIAASRNPNAGVAPGMGIRSIKVLGADGSGNMSTVLSAINTIVEQHALQPSIPMIVNLSLGVNTGSIALTTLDVALQSAWNAGIFISVAAGNDGADSSTYSPAHADVATVGSYGTTNIESIFSNIGTAVKINMPGENILSTLPGGTYGLKTGTSMSSPHVGGMAGLMLQSAPSTSPNDLWAQLGTQSLSSSNALLTQVRGQGSNRSGFVTTV